MASNKKRPRKARKTPKRRPQSAKAKADAMRASVEQSLQLGKYYEAQATDGLVNTSELLNNNGSSSHKDVIPQARRIYKTVGIVHNVIDLMTDFAAQGTCFSHKDATQEMFYNAWARKIDLFGRILHFLRSLFRDGNNVIFRHRAKLKQKDIEGLKALGQAFRELEPSKPKTIPVRYTFIDPTKVEKIGNELFGQSYEVEFSREDRRAISKPTTKEERDFARNLSRKDLLAIKKRGRITLTDENLFVSHYKKDDWEEWAEPIFFSIFDDIKFKDILRKMDESVARNIMSSIVVFKLGNTKDLLPATKKEIENFSSLLKTPTKAKQLVWNDLVTIESTYPTSNLMLNDDKYKAVNNDILSGLGVSEVLVNGLGGNYSNSFLSVKTLLEKLESARQILSQWLTVELELIRTAMGWKQLPIIKFGRMTLRDERAEKSLILDLFDKGIISKETVLGYFGENHKVEMERIRRESKEMDPFNPNNDRKKRGRPVNTDDIPQDGPRETRPKGLSNELQKSLDSVIKLVEQAVVRNRGLTDATEFSGYDAFDIIELSKQILPYVPDPGNASIEEIEEIILERMRNANS